MTADNYTPATALTGYYADRSTNRPARHWAAEKLIHDLGSLGLLTFFEGPGPNPMALTGASTSKLWLDTDAGVTTTSGTFKRYTGTGSSTDEANWIAVTPGAYLLHLGTLSPTTTVEDYATRTAAAAATIDSGVTYVRTAGYATVGDLGGGLYKKVLAEPSHAGKFQSVDTAWWELVDPIPNVYQFGATGDGTTNDTTAIQNACTYAAGKSLYVPPGTYRLDDTIAQAAVKLPAAGIRIFGAGRFLSVFRLDNDADCAMFAAIDADKVEIENLGFDGQRTGSRLAWQRAYVLRGCVRIRVANCWFYRMGDGCGLIGVQGFGGTDAYGEGTRQCERVEYQDNLIEDCWGTVAIITKFVGAQDMIITGNTVKNSCSVGISIESEDSTTEYAERIVVANNIIEGVDYTLTSGASAVSWGIAIGERCRDITCVENVIQGVAGDTISAGIIISTSPDQDDTEAIVITVAGNTIRTVTGASGRGNGIVLQAGDTTTSRIAISGNIIDATEDGIGFDLDSGAKTTGYVQNVTVSGNVISNSTEFGIFSNTLASSGALALRNCTITGNAISGSTSHGITLKAEYCTISGNNLRSNGGVGIVLATGCVGNTITENTVVLSGGNGISGVGTDTLIAANSIFNNGQTNAGTYYGINITSGARAVIVNNQIGDNQGGPTQDYGIRGQTDTIVRGNHIIGYVTGAIFGGVNNHNYALMDSHGNVSATASATSTIQAATIATGAVTVNSGVRLATI